ncbi:hypothetical protein MRB53_027996 [Persea americana]|uniref:Uncharacterized protein n=1 Tax=Persea americana TaxID=3435 RepID=A0ACC2KEA2_PERAE|nr:hypothetical protein MRB53_027996 [Persea americana]
MIGCEVFSQGLCEVGYGLSICKADPTVGVTDIKAAERAKALQNTLIAPAPAQRKKEERQSGSSPSTPTPGSGFGSSTQIFFDEKGQKHLQVPQSLPLPSPPNPSTKKGKNLFLTVIFFPFSLHLRLFNRPLLLFNRRKPRVRARH